jgi:membrane protease YdiL (CAAX protease family)
VEDETARDKRRTHVGLAAGSAAAETALPMVRRLAILRLNLWAVVLAFPFQVITPPLILWRMHGAKPSQLGLTTRRLGRNLLYGLLAFVLVTPLCYAIHQLVLWLFELWPEGGTQSHSLTLLGQQSLTAIERVLFVAATVVAAPVMEEIIFRGVLQRYFVKRRHGGAWAVGLALAFVLIGRLGSIAAAGANVSALVTELLPVLFITALAPVLLLVQRYCRTPAEPGIFGTAVLFAAIHGAWPSPVALLVLGVALGWLAWRTDSLVGPIVVHALFNGVSAVQLMWR